MNVSITILNQCFQAFVKTIPRRDQLDELIHEKGWSIFKKEITDEMEAVLKTADDHLWSYPGGVPWNQDFTKAYQDLLLSRHPWLDEESIKRVLSYSGWLCWHEGLNAPS